MRGDVTFGHNGLDDQSRSMTINSCLVIAVLFVAAYVGLHDPSGTYLEHAQMAVCVLLICVLAFTLLNRIVKDRLLELSNLIFVIFFILRIPFVYGDVVISDVYLRASEIGKVPSSLYILAYQYVVLSLCLFVVRPIAPSVSFQPLTNTEASRILKFSGVILAANVFYLLTSFKIGEDNLPNVLAIARALFNYSSVLFLLAPCLFLFDEKIFRKYRLLLYLELVVVAVCILFTGSKSGILQIFLFYLLALVVIRGPSYVISLRSTFVIAALLLVAIAFFFGGIALNQYQRNQIALVDVSSTIQLLMADTNAATAALSYRIGYLDFFIDKLNNAAYAGSFSLMAYAKAFIDAVTPGFDVYGQALVSRAVFVDAFGASGGPNSEAITVFAEAHRFAGYASFVIYLPVLLIIRVTARMLRSVSGFDRVLVGMFVVYSFQQYLVGFGLDYWLFARVGDPMIFLAVSSSYLGAAGAANRAFTTVTR